MDGFAKSRYNPGPPPRSSTIKLEAWNGGLKSTQEFVTARGQTRHIEVIGKLDGKDYPVKRNPDADTFAFRRIDENSYEVVAKKGGEVTMTSTVVVAPKRRERITKPTGKTAEGQFVENLLYWDKQ